MTYRHVDVYRVVMARYSRECTLHRRFCRHLCEVNCLSDGSTAPIKSIAMREVKGARKEEGRGWGWGELARGWRGGWAHYGLSCLETHELGKSSFQFDSAPLSLSFPLIVREGRFVACEKRSLPSPVYYHSKRRRRGSFPRLCGQTMLEINRSDPP